MKRFLCYYNQSRAIVNNYFDINQAGFYSEAGYQRSHNTKIINYYNYGTLQVWLELEIKVARGSKEDTLDRLH